MALNAWLCRIQIQRLGIPFDDLDDLAIKVNRTTVKEVVVTPRKCTAVLLQLSMTGKPITARLWQSILATCMAGFFSINMKA